MAYFHAKLDYVDASFKKKTFSEWKNLIACILCTSIQFKLKLNNLFNFFQCYISNVQSLRVMPGYTDCLQHRQGIRI